MTALLGAYISRKLKKPLYLDIRDIFTDTIGEVLPFKVGKLLKPIFLALEQYIINASSKVNLVSAGFLSYFKKWYPNKEFNLFTNGIDNQFLKVQNFKKLDITTSPRTKFADEFARDKIMKNMAKEIVRLGQNDR